MSMKNKLPRAPKSSAKFWGLVLGIPGVLIAMLLFALFYQGSAKDIIAAADRFSPGEGWELAFSRATPPRFACLGDVACPSVTRSWQYEGELNEDMVQGIARNPSLQNVVERNKCTLSEMREGHISCSVIGELGAYQATLYLKDASEQDPGLSTVTLFVNNK